MTESQKSHLLLLVKSLTQNRKEKNYVINLQNHNIDSPLNIDHSFVHNYEYVYKLWPCKPAEKQLIKISMFEKVSKNGETILVKRGEATPLVRYSEQGERFQFYGSFNERCVLVLKFRVDWKQRRDEKMEAGQFQRMDSSLNHHLQTNKDQSLSYKNYLEQTNRILKTLNAQPPTPQRGVFRNTDQKNKIAGSLYHIKHKNANHTEPSEETLKKVPQMSSLDSVPTAQKILTRDRYLHSSIDLNQSNPISQRQSSPKQQGGETSNGNEESKMSAQLEDADLDSEGRLEMSRHIKKRRQRYIGKQMEPINQAQESHFIDRSNLTNDKMNKSTRISTSERHQPIEFVNSFADKQPTALQQIVKQQSRRSLRNSKANDLTPSTATKKQHTKQSPSNSAIIRAEDFPAKSQKIAEGKIYGSIRRKKTNTQQSGIQSLIEQQFSPLHHPQPFEPNITHYSIHSKIGDRVELDSYNLTLFNFKAILYAGNKTQPKKLVIVFEDSRYSTQANSCVSLTTEWHQRFCIRSCKKHSYVYFKLISVGQKERQEGESQVVANDIINSVSKVYRSYIFSDNIAVGYLQFEHQHNQINSEENGWKREAERNSISLPQLKKKMDVSQHSKRRSSLQNRLDPANERTRSISHKYPHGIRKPVEVESYPQKYLLKDRFGQGNGKTMKSKIKEKKMMVKAKIK